MKYHFRNEREGILLSKKELIKDIFSRLNYSFEKISFDSKSVMKVRFFSSLVDL